MFHEKHLFKEFEKMGFPKETKYKHENNEQERKQFGKHWLTRRRLNQLRQLYQNPEDAIREYGGGLF